MVVRSKSVGRFITVEFWGQRSVLVTIAAYAFAD
jgi:hypothetical protein